MTGIIIADPASQDIFRDIFSGSSIEAQWVESPARVLSADAGFVMDLSFSPDPERLKILRESNAPLILINSVATPLGALDVDDRFVRINGWNTFLQRGLAEVVIPPASASLSSKLFEAWSKSVERLADVPGMPAARIVALIINEAYLALDEGVSTREAIDTAMKLGTNYPYGPFEWCRLIGPQMIYNLLKILELNNPRYSPAPLLRAEA